SGDAVAYLLDEGGRGWRLWRCNLASGRVPSGTAITDGCAGLEHGALSDRAVSGSRPAWSPDGRWLAVVRGNEHGGSDLWLVAADGSREDVVRQERRLAGGAWETRSPAFSPDGAQVAFIGGEAGALDVWTVPTEGGFPAPAHGEDES